MRRRRWAAGSQTKAACSVRIKETHTIVDFGDTCVSVTAIPAAPTIGQDKKHHCCIAQKWLASELRWKIVGFGCRAMS